MTSFTVHCTHCDTAFPVDPEKVPEGGVRARCTNCEGIFFVAEPLTAPEPVVPGPAVTPPEPAPPPEVPPTEPAPPSEVPPPGPEAEVEPLETESVEESIVPEDESGTVAEDAEEVAEGLEDSDVITEAAPHAEDDTGFGSFDDEIELVGSTPSATIVEESEIEPDVEPDVSPVVEPDVAPEPDDEAPVEEAPAADTVVELDDAVELTEEAPGLEDEIPAVPAGFQFGKRDPHDKARRLARVLVSDMITYNPDRHARALEQGTLAEDFEDEIAKSWQEYVDQVGRDMAESTPYWTNALNQVLAKGEKVF